MRMVEKKRTLTPPTSRKSPWLKMTTFSVSEKDGEEWEEALNAIDVSDIEVVMR